MKNFDDVTFYTTYTKWGTVSYAHENYFGATFHKFSIFHIPTGKAMENTIYGLSRQYAEILIRHWNAQQPDVWKYELI